MVRKLIKSLLKAAAYPEPTAKVRLIETHVSYIFISDHYVYKVKKPVDFGFLNFSTLDRRRFYCEEELRLNRRLCPDLYLGVVELRETPEGGSFAAGTKVIDYAVKMKRLPEERMLSHLLELGRVEPAQMAAIGRILAEFHAKADRGPQIDAFGGSEVIRSNWEENFRQAAPFQDEVLSRGDLALLRDWVERFLSGNAELFQARVAGGFIRECDGDLHSGNICLTDPICIFDCIEFNERFRYIDTAADISFLLMDLEYAGRPELCAPLLEAYREGSGDPVPPALLDFYKGYRAFVRGKVQCFRLREPAIAQEELAEAKASAGRYFRLARGYALRSRLAPTLIITCGLMGSGKSALARELGFQLGLTPERSDRVRKELAGAPPAAPAGGAGYHLGIYAPSFNEATYRALLQGAKKALLAGRSVIVDATFRRASDRASFALLARELGVPFFVLETNCSDELIRERLEKRRLDPGELSDGRWELFPKQRAEFEPPAQGESIRVDSSLPLPAAVDLALKGMGLLP
ncbi:MAG: kinase [Geobacteraceae bacterium GWC2_58_44]|nr:MAG: kinase [Geobacteraceae bacterium GWC2_58_44]HBG07322.1 kinase [Geobacter sp.]